MPTQDYSQAAGNYNSKFQGQARSTSEATAVSPNEQWDRDNLLHFIEDNFKTGVKGGISVENFRAFLHILVKSVRNQVDDKSKGVLVTNSMKINTVASNRSYFGSQTNGWNYFSWSQYTSSIIDNNTMPSISGLYSSTGVVAPFDLYNFSCRMTLLNDTSTGEVKVNFYYADSDEDAAVTLQNVTYIGQITKDLTVTDTGYDAAMVSAVKVPAGKRIFMFVRNSGHGGSGNEGLRISYTMHYDTHSENWGT